MRRLCTNGARPPKRMPISMAQLVVHRSALRALSEGEIPNKAARFVNWVRSVILTSQ